MKTPSQRRIASQLGVSIATVSRALHQDPRVHPRTAGRVRALLKKEGYQLDPAVSHGMSRMRRRDFHRETIAWCHDLPREKMPWLRELFESAEHYGARIGYKIEHFKFDSPAPRTLARLTSIWKARGIQGVLLGPFNSAPRELAFPWDDLSWVTIGGTFIHPHLHLVGRDYATDIQAGLEWLGTRGCRRPCFVLDPTVNAFFRRALLESALAHYHAAENPPPNPYCELNPDAPEVFAAWFAANRPDGVVLPAALGDNRQSFAALLNGLPTVLLSPPAKRGGRNQLHFTARYEVIGQAAVNVLHRLLRNRETGLPAYKQSVLIDSRTSRATGR